MDGLAVGGDDGQAVAFDGDLSWAHGREGVDHAESVASAWRHGEDLQRRVGHEAGVWITELTFAVDQHRLGILTCIHSQAAGISLCGIFVQPIGQQHHVRREIKVVEMRIGVA